MPASLLLALRFMTVIRVLTLMSALFCAFAASGAFSAEPYFSAQVPVVSQSRNERSQAAQRALLDVLVRVTGSESIRDNSLVEARKNRALSLVELYQYGELNDPVMREQGYTASLELQFSERLIKRMLRDAQACFWSVKRPNTLVWLVEDSLDYGKQLLPYDEGHPVFAGLQSQADYRGVPLSFPLNDFQDQTSLGPGMLWALDEAAIRAASMRYQVDTIVVGKLTQTSRGELWSNWLYLYPEATRLLDLRSADAAELGPAVINPLANSLAQQFAVCASEEDSRAFHMQVTGIRSFAAYRGLVDALEGIEAITKLSIAQADKDTLNLSIESDASREQLQRLIGLTRSLSELNSSDTEYAGNAAWNMPKLGSKQRPWRYRWER